MTGPASAGFGLLRINHHTTIDAISITATDTIASRVRVPLHSRRMAAALALLWPWASQPQAMAGDILRGGRTATPSKAGFSAPQVAIFKAGVAERIPMKRLGTAEEVAGGARPV